jgi:hypothetical protein
MFIHYAREAYATAWPRMRSAAPLLGTASAVASCLALGLAPNASFACACGCGVFDVGTVTMMSSQPGGMIYLEDDYQSQNQNWVHSHPAPASANTDKEIQTNFAGLGMVYQFSSDWGADIKIPYWDRLFRTDIGDPGAPDVVTFRHSALGDIRLQARYTGLSSVTQTTGISFGVKLPSGDWTYPNFDRDTSIGTGTTDLLVGAYHLGNVGFLSQEGTGRLQWFGEFLLDRSFNTREQYRPGNEMDAALGLIYSGIQVGPTVSLSPLLQVIASDRLHDSGANADPANSGYERLLISPGLEANVGQLALYVDAEIRTIHYANAAASVAVQGTQGQLVAPVLIKAMVSYSW